MMTIGRRQAYVLAIAYPAQGHGGPLVKLSLLIADQGIKVIFFNAASIRARVLATVSSENGKIHDLIDIVIDLDGVDPQDGRKERIQLSESMQRVMPSHLENLIMKINSSEDDQMIASLLMQLLLGHLTLLRRWASRRLCFGLVL